MGIGNLFRPKHKHSNPDVRARAVRDLAAEQNKLVAEIAETDEDVRVRKVAINLLEDPADLVSVARAQQDSTLRRLAHGRAMDLWTKLALAKDESAARDAVNGIIGAADQKALAEIAARADSIDVRQLALAGLSEPKALAELARNGSNSKVRLGAMKRIDDAEVLRSIAMDEQRKAIAFAAVDRIDDREALQQIAAKAKNKAVRSRARKKVSEMKSEAAPEAAEQKAARAEMRRRHAERAQLARQVQELANTEEWLDSLELIAAAKAEWAELGDAVADGDDKLQKKFSDSVGRYQHRRARHAAEIAQAERAKQAKLKAEMAKEPTPEAKSKDEGPAEVVAEPSAHMAAANTGGADTGVAEAGVADAGVANAGVAEAGVADAGVADVGGAEAGGADAGGAEAGGAEAGGAEAGDDKSTAAKPAAGDAQAKRQAQRAERDAAAVAQLEALCTELDEGLDLISLKSADRVLSRCHKKFSQIKVPGSARALVARYDEARNKLFIKVQELREADEWLRFANVPKCEALIKRAEALLADEAATDLGEQLKQLQTDWKKNSALPKNKADTLWESFKATCDKIYERVKASRGQQNEERKANLRAKEQLCEQVEPLADSTNWDETAQRIKQLQTEWKSIGPVPRRNADAVWKRFRSACDRFFEARKPHLEASLADRTKNLEAKIKLLERVEGLVDSTDWGPTSAELRDIQKDWRAIGYGPRKEGAEATKRFRAACDAFFKARENAKKAERDAEVQRVQGVADEIDKIAQIASGDAEGDDAWVDTKELVERLLTIRTKFLELDQRDQKQTVRDALARACLLMVEAHSDSFADTELDPEASRKRKQKLVDRAEELAPEQDDKQLAEPQTPEQVAERLRAALAENALGVSKDDDGAIAEIAELKVSWQRLGPVPGSIGTELDERFQKACSRTLAAYE